MSPKPETKISDEIQEWVKDHGGNVLKVYGNAIQRKGEPDLIGGVWLNLSPAAKLAVHFAIELKVPGEEASNLQKYRMKQWEKVGFITGTAHSLKEFKELIGWYDDYSDFMGSPTSD